MNHAVYYIGGPWDQHKVLRSEAPKGWEVVAVMSALDIRPFDAVKESAKLPHKTETYRIDKIGETSEAMIYMARHVGVLDHGY